MNSEMTEREYERMLDTFTTASEWHGGQWSALYSYSSTGEVHGEEHQADLLTEIENCQTIAQHQEDVTELDRDALEHLRYTVECWPEGVV